MDRLRLWVDRLADLLFALALLAGALMMGHVTVDILARWFFNSPLPGANETTAAYYTVAAAFLPLAYVTRTQGHISVELFTQRMSPANQRRTAIFGDVLTLVYLGLLAWQGTVGALDATQEKEVWEIPGGFLPVWPMRWAVPAAAVSMGLYVALHLVQLIVSPAGADDDADAGGASSTDSSRKA